MEVMDTSLDKFYKMVYQNGLRIEEPVLAKIVLGVSIAFVWSHCTRKAHFQLKGVHASGNKGPKLPKDSTKGDP